MAAAAAATTMIMMMMMVMTQFRARHIRLGCRRVIYTQFNLAPANLDGVPAARFRQPTPKVWRLQRQHHCYRVD